VKILIVDDVKDSLDLLEDILTTYNFETVRARNGAEALDQLARHTVQLIISDVLMPKMDGFQLCREVKRRPQFKPIPFIFYTANYIDPADEHFARSLGADRYLIKPIDISVLINAVNETTKSTASESVPMPEGDESAGESEYLKEYNAVLIKKLEDKMFELERVNDMLILKNKELQVSHERYRNLFESASIATFILEPASWNILDANRQAEKLLGLMREEMFGRPFQFYTERLQQARNSEKPVFYEGEFTTGHGNELFVEVNAGLIDNSDRSVVMAFVRDVTEQRKLKEKLLQAERLALLGELSAGIAHEIRNPLAAININLQFLLRTLDIERPERKVVETALQGVDRIDGIVSDTLNFAKPAKPVFKLHAVNEIIQATVPLAKISMGKKNVQVVLDLADNLPPVSVDFKQIQQVIVNLLTNAADAIKGKGRISIRSGVTHPTAYPRGVVVTVIDNGEGMTKEEMKKIFDPFYTKKASGTGLGLSVSQQILNFHGASIDVSSELGKGTTFQVIFPINTTSPEE
jgi:PAS domain S-box-containing protein